MIIKSSSKASMSSTFSFPFDNSFINNDILPTNSIFNGYT